MLQEYTTGSRGGQSVFFAEHKSPEAVREIPLEHVAPTRGQPTLSPRIVRHS